MAAFDDASSRRKGRLSTLVAFLATLLGACLLVFRRPSEAPFSTRSGRGGHSTPASPAAVAVGYEVVDAKSVSIIKWAALLFGSAVLAVGLMVVLVNIFEAGTARRDSRLTPEQTTAIVVPLPHLQAAPYLDLHRERAREDGLLSGYAWLGAGHSAARIPIARAMQLSVGRSLDLGPLSATSGAVASAPGGAGR